MPRTFGVLQLCRGAACVAVAVAAFSPALAQKPGAGGGTSHPTPTPTPMPSPTRSRGSPSQPYGGSPYGVYSPNFPMETISPEQANLYDRLRRQERQKRVVKDTDRLVALTAEYQQMLQREAPAADSERKLHDIEKLARDLRTTLVQ